MFQSIKAVRRSEQFLFSSLQNRPFVQQHTDEDEHDDDDDDEHSGWPVPAGFRE